MKFWPKTLASKYTVNNCDNLPLSFGQILGWVHVSSLVLQEMSPELSPVSVTIEKMSLNFLIPNATIIVD